MIILHCDRNKGLNTGHGILSYLFITYCDEFNYIHGWKRLGHRRVFRCDRLVVRTLRCGRNNPGSNPGHGMNCFHIY